MKKVVCIILMLLLSISMCSCANENKHENEVKIPLSNDYLDGVSYEEALEQFNKAGFRNVETEKIEDLITGWLKKDGEIEKITVDGKSDFRKGAWVQKDAHVIIKYHTYPSNDSKEGEKEAAAEQTTGEQEAKEIKHTPIVFGVVPDLKKAQRSVVVAITNAHADDVFKKDGNTIDTAKFHSYSDLSGFYLTVKNWGEWSGKDNNIWHGESISLEIFDTGLDIQVDAVDVSFDGNYHVSNLSGEFGTSSSLEEMESYSDANIYLTVSPKLVEKDRDKEEKSKDKSDLLDSYTAQQAFEKYGKALYPYGFKCHWYKDLINAEQDKKTGSWFLKVGVTVTNEYGASYDTTAEGRVTGTNDNPKVEDFYLY